VGLHMLSAAENLSEPFQCEDIYVDTLGAIEDAGDGNTRYIFCVKRRGGADIKVQLVTGPTLVWHTIRMTMAHFGRKCCGATAERHTH
jgi:hypothetical protein